MHDPDQSIGFLLNDVSRLLRRNFHRRAEELGLSQAQWRALAYLSLQEGVKQVTLAESLELQPMTVARLIDRLQEAGLVDRLPDPEDRRAFRLHLTAKAQPLIDRMWALAAETREEALAAIDEADKAVLMETLRRVKLNLLDAESRAQPNDTDSTDLPREKGLADATGKF